MCYQKAPAVAAGFIGELRERREQSERAHEGDAQRRRLFPQSHNDIIYEDTDERLFEPPVRRSLKRVADGWPAETRPPVGPESIPASVMVDGSSEEF